MWRAQHHLLCGAASPVSGPGGEYGALHCIGCGALWSWWSVVGSQLECVAVVGVGTLGRPPRGVPLLPVGNLCGGGWLVGMLVVVNWLVACIGVVLVDRCLLSDADELM